MLRRTRVLRPDGILGSKSAMQHIHIFIYNIEYVYVFIIYKYVYVLRRTRVLRPDGILGSKSAMPSKALSPGDFAKRIFRIRSMK